jgi:two-component system, LuxR family, response regulator FixJ
MSTRVHIIDDDDAVRRALRLLLQSADIDAADYGSAKEFLDRAPSLTAEERGCLIVDVSMPGMSGLELQSELRARDIDVPVIVISGHGDVPMAVSAMRKGAVTFLMKTVNDQELIDTVNEILSQPRELSRAQAALEAHRSRLTPRQREVFDLLRQGLRTKEVAKRLGVSPRTVEVHRAKLLERLEASSLTHLIGRLLEDSSDEPARDPPAAGGSPPHES